MEGPLARGFSEASQFFLEATALIADDGWDVPALGSWSMRELVGHANRSHTLIEEYLLRSQPPEPPGSAYFTEESIAKRARESVVVLGSDPVAAVQRSSAAAIALVEKTDPSARLGSPAGTMTLSQYLPSRIAELTIHSLDIARAQKVELVVPTNAMTESLLFVAKRSANKDGVTVLRALTGRESLPKGYCAI